MNPTVIGGIIAAAAGIAAAFLQFVSQRSRIRADLEAPASVADGYGRLVADLQKELVRMKAEVETCHQERASDRIRIAALENEVAALHDRVFRPGDARTRSTDGHDERPDNG